MDSALPALKSQKPDAIGSGAQANALLYAVGKLICLAFSLCFCVSLAYRVVMDLKQAKTHIEELNKEILQIEVKKQLRDSLVKYVESFGGGAEVKGEPFRLVKKPLLSKSETKREELNTTDLVKGAVDAMNGQDFGVADIHAHLAAEGKDVSKLDVSSVLSRSKGKWIALVHKGKGSQPNIYRKAA